MTDISKEDLDGLMALMDDVRCEVIEAQKKIESTHAKPDAALQVQLDAIWSVVSHPPDDPCMPLLAELLQVLVPVKKARPWWQRWEWPAVGLLAGAVCFGAGWWQGGTAQNVRLWGTLGQRVDGVLLEHYQGLSRPAQEAMNNVYRELQIMTPGERKGKRT